MYLPCKLDYWSHRTADSRARSGHQCLQETRSAGCPPPCPSNRHTLLRAVWITSAGVARRPRMRSQDFCRTDDAGIDLSFMGI